MYGVLRKQGSGWAVFVGRAAAVLTAPLLVVTAYAAPPGADEATRSLDRAQQQEQQRQQLERQEQQARQPHTVIELPSQETPATDTKNSGCHKVMAISLDGALHLDAASQENIKKKYQGKCLAVSDIESLLGDITAEYVKRGYIGARAYIQTQDLKFGLLHVLVVEGQVQSLQLQDGGQHSVNLSTAFPGVVGEPLNLRDFEQGLDQINRLSSNHATLALEPGERPGDSIVAIQNVPGRRLHANATYDNYGSSTTGKDEAGLTLMLDDPLRINDGAMVTHRRSVSSGFSERHSRTTSMLYSVPMGYFLLTASQVFSDYATPVVLPSVTLSATGKSSTTSLQLDYLAYRDQVSKLTFSSVLTVKSNRNYLAGTKLDTSSRRLSSADLRAAWNSVLGGGAFSVSGDYVRGVNWFGAYRDNDGLPDDAPHAQYGKWLASANWTRPFDVASHRLLYSTSLNSQWGEKTLYGNDQFLIGSIFSVRGFSDRSLSGDRGFYWRNDVSAPMAANVVSVPVALRPSVGLDMGQIWARNGEATRTLTGAAIGCSASVYDLSVDLQAVRPLSQPAGFPDRKVSWFLNVSLAI